MSEVKEAAAINNANKVLEIDGNAFVLLPEGYKVGDLERYEEAPRRVSTRHEFTNKDSFVEYVERHKVKESTAIFADLKNCNLMASIDYHTPINEPKWCDHTVTLPLHTSKEWTLWNSANGQTMDQSTFADFLESRASDIVEPAGAEILEVALKFKVIRKAVFSSQKRISTGEFQFSYSEENDKGTVELPEVITLALSPFKIGVKYEVKARLRYRLREGVLSFSYGLIDPDLVLEDAFNELVQSLKGDAKLSGVPVYEASL